MRYLIFVPVVLVSLLALALSVPGVQAKGPVSLVLRGGDLPQPIRIEGPIQTEQLFQHPESFPASFNPRPAPAYSLDIYPVGDDGASQNPETTLAYFPASDGQPALLRVQGGKYMIANSELAQLMDSKISAALGTLEGPSTNTSGDWRFWYVAPALALGLVLLAGGRTILRRRGVRVRARV